VAAEPFVSFMLFNSTEAGDKCFDVVLNEADTAALFDKIGLAFQGSCLQAVQLTGLSVNLLTDADADGLADNVESVILGTDPANHDSDLDELSDGYEVLTFATDPLLPDTDYDGCADGEELEISLDPLAWYDFYDVPVPAYPDATPNGPRNKVIDIGDVLAVLFYVFADEGGPPNANGVSYDSLKDGDWNGDTVVDANDRVGLRYDRTPGSEPNPPWDAGPPNGVIDIGDVLACQAQAFVLDCTAPP